MELVEHHVQILGRALTAVTHPLTITRAYLTPPKRQRSAGKKP